MYLPGGGLPAWRGGSLPGGYLPGGGMYLPGGGCTCLEGGVPAWRGVYLPGPGEVCLVRYSPPVNRMTDAWENITLAKTSFRPVIILICSKLIAFLVIWAQRILFK